MPGTVLSQPWTRSVESSCFSLLLSPFHKRGYGGPARRGWVFSLVHDAFLTAFHGFSEQMRLTLSTVLCGAAVNRFHQQGDEARPSEAACAAPSAGWCIAGT